MGRRIVMIAIVLLLPQCNRTTADVVASHREAATKRVAQIQALAKVVADTPPLTEDGVRIDGPVPDFSEDGREREGRAAVLMDTDLEAPATYSKSLLRPEGPSAVVIAASIAMTGALPDGKQPGAPRVADGWLDLLEELRYVLVVRMLDHRAPVARGAGYDSGWIRAEALLFDLETTKLLGGFRMQTTSGETVDTSRALQDALNSFERWYLRRAIRVGVSRHLPRTNLPPG